MKGYYVCNNTTRPTVPAWFIPRSTTTYTTTSHRVHSSYDYEKQTLQPNLGEHYHIGAHTSDDSRHLCVRHNNGYHYSDTQPWYSRVICAFSRRSVYGFAAANHVPPRSPTIAALSGPSGKAYKYGSRSVLRSFPLAFSTRELCLLLSPTLMKKYLS